MGAGSRHEQHRSFAADQLPAGELCHHSPISAGDFQARPDAGMFPCIWLGETPGTRSQPRANPVPRIFGQMTLPWVPPSAEAVETVPSGSQLPTPPARLGHPPVPITQPAATSPCPPLAHLLSPHWHTQRISTSPMAPVPRHAGASTGTPPHPGWPATSLWWHWQC